MILKNPAFLFLAQHLVALVVMADNEKNDVPGCACPATACQGWGHDNDVENVERRRDLAVCTGVVRSDPPYYFPGITTTTTNMSICDAVDGNEEFQATYGTTADEFFWTTAAGTTGPWSKSGWVTTLMGMGTCADAAMREQLSCFPNHATARTSTSVVTSSGGIVEPGACGQFTSVPFPNENTSSVAISVRCRGYFAPAGETVYGMDTYLQVLHGTETVDLCDKTNVDNFLPFLTADDWKEPQPGRRFACGDFTNPVSGKPYYVFIASLGNEPCTGSTPEQDPPASVPHGATGHFFRILTVWIVLLVVARIISV